MRVSSTGATDPCDGGDATSPQPYVACIDRSHYSVQRQLLIASMDMQDSQDVSETASPHPYVASVDMDISVNPNIHIASMNLGDGHRAASPRPYIPNSDMSTLVQQNVLIASMDDGDLRIDRHHDGVLHEVYTNAPKEPQLYLASIDMDTSYRPQALRASMDMDSTIECVASMPLANAPTAHNAGNSHLQGGQVEMRYAHDPYTALRPRVLIASMDMEGTQERAVPVSHGIPSAGALVQNDSAPYHHKRFNSFEPRCVHWEYGRG